ncbi:MAG: acetylglutamate kinase [Victivallaceae bacterium]|nr:acetylglutamate kinase [Victivallaceae bacterium]
MMTNIQKADILAEALPYIQKFRNAVIVVKFGGSSMEDPELVASTMRDVVIMEAIGFRPVVVHGGGKAISAELKKRDIPVKFVNGLRHTCDRTIAVVDDVLHNQVNRELVRLAQSFGGAAAALSGKEIFTARRTWSTDPLTGKKEDIGFVGEIVSVDADKISAMLSSGKIPVITPLGRDSSGRIYNINADVAACHVAEALKARKLVFLSDVPGVMRDPKDPSTVIETIRTDEIPELIQSKVLTGGMLPKIASCVEALEAGTNKVHLIDGRVMHSLLLEIFTDSGIGTQIVRPDSIL